MVSNVPNDPQGSSVMRTRNAIVLSSLTAILGAVAVQALHAQTKAPAFYVGEVDVTDEAGYQKEFVSQSGAAIQASGGHFIVRGGKATTLVGEPVKNRIVIQQWQSMDQLRKWFDSPEQVKLREIQAKYSKVRAYAVEGIAPK
jgi:uncharacterized protein (DUF1330 family)